MKLTGPGFVDLQVNGFAGVDFNNPAVTPDDVRRAADAMARHGVTVFLPTLITSSPEDFAVCARAVLSAAHPAVAGFHMEGPYISPLDGPRGAHRREMTAPPSLDDFRRRQDAAEGRILIVTLAPELPGALPLIAALAEMGVRVAIGHSAATAEQVRDAVAAGATLSTHLGNGVASTLPRHPNLIWAQLAADELTAGLIVDGHHLPADTVKVMIRAKTPARAVLVTDATAAAGCAPGLYTIGGQTVELDARGRVALPGGGCLAGSALTLDRAVANAVRFAGVSIEEAMAMASTRPAAAAGIAPRGRVAAEWDPEAFRLMVIETNAEAAP